MHADIGLFVVYEDTLSSGLKYLSFVFILNLNQLNTFQSIYLRSDHFNIDNLARFDRVFYASKYGRPLWRKV